MTFAHYVESFQTLYLNEKKASAPQLPPLKDLVSFTSRTLLILAPHPDDECLMSGFAIRAKEEWAAKVVVVPFSYGSNVARREERKRELQAAVSILGFELFDPRVNHQELLSPNEFNRALQAVQPDTLIIPHAEDGHPVHKRTSQFAKDCLPSFLKTDSKTGSMQVLETEFWQSMAHPNLLLPLNSSHLRKMGEALAAHVGEVSRNPYHLTLPAWAMDAVRRGSEMSESSKAGSAGITAVFGQLYRVERISSTS